MLVVCVCICVCRPASVCMLLFRTVAYSEWNHRDLILTHHILWDRMGLASLNHRSSFGKRENPVRVAGILSPYTHTDIPSLFYDKMAREHSVVYAM